MMNKLPVRYVVEANTECLANISGEGKEEGRKMREEEKKES